MKLSVRKWWLVWVAALVLLAPAAAPACTAFALVDSQGVWLGKNLDWELAHGLVLTHARDQNQGRLYASLTFHQFSGELPLGGMNEAGLVVEQLSYAPSVFPEPGARLVLDELRFIQHLLDRCATVAEALQELERVAVQRRWFGLHYFLADRTAEAAALEFLDGRAVIHRGREFDPPLLVNNTYANSLRYLARHQGFGGGRQENSGPESPERFVRAARRLAAWQKGEGRLGPQEFALATLETVQQEDTRWSLVYDLTNLTIRVRVQGCTEDREVSIREASGAATRLLDLTGAVDASALRDFRLFTRDHEHRLRQLTAARLGVDPGQQYEDGQNLQQ